MSTAKNSPSRRVWEKARAGGYLTQADFATLIRAALKTAFPATRFSVTSSTYAGGCSVDVRWEDGPAVRQVDAIVGQYQAKGFDGSIDMAYSATLWLAPDGTASIAEERGTKGSGGCVPETIGSPHSPDAVLLTRMSRPYIHTCRNLSTPFIVEIIRGLCARNRVTEQGEEVAIVALAEAYRHGNADGAVPWMGGASGNPWGPDSWNTVISEAISMTGHDQTFLTAR